MSEVEAPPPELGLLLATLSVDPTVTCPVARFGRLVHEEWKQGGKGTPVREIIMSLSDRCSTEEEQLGNQIEQYRIAHDKLASELQRVDAQLATAEKKRSEAQQFRKYCATVINGMVGFDTAVAFSQPAHRAGPREDSGHHSSGRSGSDDTAYVLSSYNSASTSVPDAPPARNPPIPEKQSKASAEPSLGESSATGEISQVLSLLALPDVKETTLTHALSRCESHCLVNAETPWFNAEEYELALKLCFAIAAHLPEPRPPLQLVELRILSAVIRRAMSQAIPRGLKDKSITFIDAIEGDNRAIANVGKLLGSVNDEVKCEACEFLVNVMVDDAAKMCFVKSGAISTLVAVVAQSTNELVLEKSLYLMYCLTNTDDRIRAAIREEDGLRPVIDLLYTDSIPILENAILTLGFMTREEETKAAARECGGLEKFVATLYHPSEGIVAKAAGVLWNCASSKENRVVLRQLGAIPSLIELLGHKNDAIQENAAGALWNITVEPDNRKLIVDYMGIPPLIKLLKSRRELVVENASGTLWNCSATVEVRASIRKSNGLQELLAILTHPNPSIQENAAGAIRNCAINDQNKSTLRELGGIELFLDLIRTTSPDVRDKLVSTLWIMTVAPENKHAIRTANGFPVMAELIHCNDLVVVEKALGTLRNCSMVTENRAAMVQAGIVTAASSFAKSNKDKLLAMTSSLKENLAAMLWQITRDEKAAVRNDGGLDVCAMLLKDKEDGVIEQAAGAISSLANNSNDNRDAVRDSGAFEQLLLLLNNAAIASTSTHSGAKALHSFALQHVLLAVRNCTSNNSINQRLAAEKKAIPALLDLIKVHTRGQRPAPAAAGTQSYSPDEIAREALLCIKNIASEKQGSEEVQKHGGIQLIQGLLESPEAADAVKKAASMAQQSLSRYVRFQSIKENTRPVTVTTTSLH